MDNKPLPTGNYFLKIQYAKEKFWSLSSFFDRLGKTPPLLVTPEGEEIVAGVYNNKEFPFKNSTLIYHPSVARELADKNGWMFFDEGSIKDHLFTREFEYSLFIRALESFVGDIDPNLTTERDGSTVKYIDMAKEVVEEWKAEAIYVLNAGLKWNVDRVSSKDARIVGKLKEEYLSEEFKGSKRNYNGGLKTANLVLDIDNSQYSGNMQIADRKLQAIFTPTLIVDNFSQNDLEVTKKVVDSYMDRLFLGINKMFRGEMHYSEREIEVNYSIYDRDRKRREIQTKELLPGFSAKCLATARTLENIARMKKREHGRLIGGLLAELD